MFLRVVDTTYNTIQCGVATAVRPLRSSKKEKSVQCKLQDTAGSKVNLLWHAVLGLNKIKTLLHISSNSSLPTTIVLAPMCRGLDENI